MLPLIKKPGLDQSVPANYRPISNLHTVSKIIERLVLVRLKPHLLATGNFNPLQSAYRSGHSTETALQRILDSFYKAIDGKKLTVLISLDISAAFDTINHSKLLSRFRNEFGVTDIALNWLKSYIEDRHQFVKLGRHSSATVCCTSGVPQGSVLGPLIFAAYVSPIGEVISSHGVDHHQYADDTQLFLAMCTSTIRSNLSTLEICSQAVKHWFADNDLLLNADKSEAMLVGSSSQLKAASNVNTVSVAGVSLPVSVEIKSLGVVIDNKLTFDTHVRAICKACNYHTWALRHIRHYLPLPVAQTLACSIVGSRLDYCNSVLYGAPKSSIAKLQRVQNMLARVVLNKPRRTHSTELLQSLHWLPVKERIDFKVALLTYKVRYSSTPDYLFNLLSDRVINSSLTLRSSSKHVLYVPRSRTVCGARAFSIAAPTVWNKLPADVQISTSVACFKSRLKTFLFRTVYNC